MYILRLRESLSAITEGRSDIKVVNDFEDIPLDTTDAVLIDSAQCETNEVFQTTLPEESTVYYLVDEITPALQSWSDGISIRLLLADELLKWLTQQETSQSQPIVTFWGAAPQYGTTTIATAVGSFLAQEYDLHVGILGLNLFDPGSWVLENPTNYLDDLRSYIISRTLTQEQLKGAMGRLPSGAYYLPGNRNQSLAMQFDLSHIHHLVQSAKSAFDVVILDAGSALTAAAIQALTVGQVYALLTDRLYAQIQFNTHAQYVLRPLGINTEDILLIGNKMDRPRQNVLADYAKATRTTPLSVFPDVKQTIYYSEQNPDRLRAFMDIKQVKTEVKKIADGIASRYGFMQIRA